jgi:hypothetical protein
MLAECTTKLTSAQFIYIHGRQYKEPIDNFEPKSTGTLKKKRGK